MNRVFLLLGSNIEKEQNLPAAIRLLAERCHLLAVSAIYETAPVGLLEQPNFFNAAALIETQLTAAELKTKMVNDLERSLNRTRQANKNAPRTIDVDIILFNDEVFDYVGRRSGRTRHIPDPDLLKFVHAAVPIAEIAPDMLHPETGQPLQAIAQRLLSQTPIAPRPVQL